MVITAALIATTARLLQPLITDLYQGSKKAGVRGLQRWEQQKFPQKLARRIRALEEVKTVWKPDGGVSLLDFYHPPKVELDGKGSLVNRLSELGTDNLIIEGIVGQGKSILLRSLAINEILSNDAKRLPIFLELRTLTSKLGLREAIHRQLEAFDIDVDADSLAYLYRSGKISILLDGFDEIEENLIKETYQEIEFLVQRFPELQLVITSRLGNEIQKSVAFRVVEIAPLTPAEFPAFLEKLKVSTEKSIEIRNAIRVSPSKVSTLITTPLMLTLVVIVYETESEIPETLPEFFEKLFQVVFTRHDRLKAAFSRKHYSGLSERRLQRLFASFCFMVLQLGYTRTLTTDQFSESFEMAASYTEDCKCEMEMFKQDITKVACLMLEEGIDSITFLHKSILEYYAAAFVQHLTEDNAKLFYSEVADKTHGWDEVLIFLRAIDSFRYSTYYVLPVIDMHNKKIVAPMLAASDEELGELVKRVFPDVGAYFRRSVKSERGDRVDIAGYGPIHPIAGHDVGEFGYLVMDAIRESLPADLSEEDFQQNLGPADLTRVEGHIGVHVSVSRIMKEFGADQMRRAIGIFQTRLAAADRDAQKVIAAQEKKKLIFIKKVAA